MLLNIQSMHLFIQIKVTHLAYLNTQNIHFKVKIKNIFIYIELNLFYFVTNNNLSRYLLNYNKYELANISSTSKY